MAELSLIIPMPSALSALPFYLFTVLITPRNNGRPDSSCTIAKTNGLSNLTSKRGTLGAAPPLHAIKVTAAAFVPFLSTSICALCLILATKDRGNETNLP